MAQNSRVWVIILVSVTCLGLAGGMIFLMARSHRPVGGWPHAAREYVAQLLHNRADRREGVVRPVDPALDAAPVDTSVGDIWTLDDGSDEEPAYQEVIDVRDVFHGLMLARDHGADEAVPDSATAPDDPQPDRAPRIPPFDDFGPSSSPSHPKILPFDRSAPSDGGGQPKILPFDRSTPKGVGEQPNILPFDRSASPDGDDQPKTSPLERAPRIPPFDRSGSSRSQPPPKIPPLVKPVPSKPGVLPPTILPSAAKAEPAAVEAPVVPESPAAEVPESPAAEVPESPAVEVPVVPESPAAEVPESPAAEVPESPAEPEALPAKERASETG